MEIFYLFRLNDKKFQEDSKSEDNRKLKIETHVAREYGEPDTQWTVYSTISGHGKVTEL